MTRWVDVAEAAEILGVSIYTVKRRAKQGDIPAEQRETPTGFKWYVEVPDTSLRQQSESTEALLAAAGEIAALQQLVDELIADKEKLWEEVEVRRREVSELHILLQRALQQSPPQLPPPQDYTVAVSTATADSAAPLQQAKNSFWKRFFGTV